MNIIGLLSGQAILRSSVIKYLNGVDERVGLLLGVINQNKGYEGAEQNLPPLETIEE